MGLFLFTRASLATIKHGHTWVWPQISSIPPCVVAVQPPIGVGGLGRRANHSPPITIASLAAVFGAGGAAAAAVAVHSGGLATRSGQTTGGARGWITPHATAIHQHSSGNR